MRPVNRVCLFVVGQRNCHDDDVDANTRMPIHAEALGMGHDIHHHSYRRHGNGLWRRCPYISRSEAVIIASVGRMKYVRRITGNRMTSRCHNYHYGHPQASRCGGSPRGPWYVTISVVVMETVNDDALPFAWLFIRPTLPWTSVCHGSTTTVLHEVIYGLSQGRPAGRSLC